MGHLWLPEWLTEVLEFIGVVKKPWLRIFFSFAGNPFAPRSVDPIDAGHGEK
jgi:hypothetical protein